MNIKMYPMLPGALLVCCWACQKDELTEVPVSGARVSLSVSEARQWFDQHLASQREITDEVTGQTRTRIPRWHQAQVVAWSGQGNRIRVPLDYAEDVMLGAGAENSREIYHFSGQCLRM
jgi:hypothetical protein